MGAESLWSEKTSTLLSKKITRVLEKKTVLDSLMATVEPESQASLREHEMVNSARTSLGVEDIPVTKEEAAAEYQDVLAPTLPRTSRKALEGHFHGDILANLLISQSMDLKVEHIKAVHAMVVGREHPEMAGQFRTGAVRVGGSERVFCGPTDVPKHMEAFVSRVNQSPDTAVVKALFSHLGIVYVHGFGDGNGRTGRIVQNAILAREGYPPIVIPETSRTQYRKQMEDAFFGKPEGLYSMLLDRLEIALDDKIKVLQGERGTEKTRDLFERD